MKERLSRANSLVWLATGTLLAGLVASTAWLVNAQRTDALARAGELVARSVAVAEADLNRTLLALDLQLTSLPEVVNMSRRADPPFDREAAHQALARLKDRQLSFNDVALIDADGHTLAAAMPSSDRNGMTLPPGYVAGAFAQAVPQLMVSDPAISRMSTEPALYLARVVPWPDGQRVLAVAELPATLLVSILAQATDASTQLAVTLERDDGRLLVSVPARTGLGVARPALPLPPMDALGTPQRAPSRLGGAEALVAVRPTLYRSLLVTASLPLDAALGAWRQNRTILFAAAAALIALTLAGGLLSQWQYNRLADAREALGRSVDTLDQALASMADGFLLCDADDRVVRWNTRFLELFPWLRGVVAPGLPYADLAEALAKAAAPRDRAARIDTVDQLLRQHRIGGGQWEHDFSDGRVVQATECSTPEGGVVGIYHDVTAAERRLAQAKRHAEIANEAKSQFLATMSHEIRTPLNAVLGLNALMLQSGLDAEQRQHAELIGSSGRLLLAVINDILDVSRIEAGHLQLDVAPFDPASAATEVVALMRERAQARGLALRLTLGKDAATPLLGDAIRLQQVLFNLVGNAIKFTDAGEVHLHLAQRPQADGTALLEIAVSDTGIGIPEAALPTLFDRFTQADGSSMRRHGGSGLGLAITREIVQKMGGSIAVTRSAAQGSCFEVRIPCPVAPAAGLAPQANPAAAAPPAFGRKRILVAEDNDVNQILMRAALERLGHQVDIVDDGAAALDQVQRSPYDLVLMDLQMPRMDGTQAARAIRALAPPTGAVPIVAMTANAFDADRQACLDAGMTDYLAKPIDLAELALAIERLAP